MKKFMYAAIAVLCVSVLSYQSLWVSAAMVRGMDLYYVPEWPVTVSQDTSKLLLSDSPEMVQEEGILYRDQVQGTARLFFYHVNAMSSARKIDVLVENKNKQPAHITVNRHSLAGPAYDWMAVGKGALRSYLAVGKPYQIVIPAGGMQSLALEIGETAMLPNMLINGIYDFTTDLPVNVAVMMMPLLADSDVFYKTAKVLPVDEYRLRGTFSGANRQITPVRAYDAARDGMVTVTLADNRFDRYVEGVDATDGSSALNYGNYGIVYDINFPSKAQSRFSCYLVPQGGPYAGVLGVKSPGYMWSPLETPKGQLYFGRKDANDSAFVGTFDGNRSLQFTFSPPGASNLPVALVFVPQ